jgi:hypothetical protein
MVKISELLNLAIVESNDLIPIIDVSETSPQNKNKTITVANLYPYLNTNLNGASATNISLNSISLGADNVMTADPTNEFNYIIGSSNNIIGPDKVFQTIIGFNNYIEGVNRESQIVGYGNLIEEDSTNCSIFGANSSVGLGSTSNVDTFSIYSGYSTGVGESITIQGPYCTALGYGCRTYDGSESCIAIGNNTETSIERITAGVPNPLVDAAIAIGDSTIASKSYSVALGYNVINNARYGCALGAYAEIETGADDSICVGGGTIESLGVESIAIGTFSYVKGPASIAIGARASCNNTTNASIAIGNGAAARSANSLVMGENSGVTINNNENNIIIGSFSGISNDSPNSIVIGAYANLALINPRNILIGNAGQINNNTTDSVAIGYNSVINSGLTNSVQLGTGVCNESNTLQFLNTPIANDKSIQATTQNTGLAPTYTAPNGTIVVDENGTGKIYVRVAGTWRSTSLT